MQDPRESLQKLAKEKWLASGRKNSLILPTGSGKSKVAIEIIRERDPLKIILLTNSEDLRDTTWKNEFEKFGVLGYWENTNSQCYQTMYSREWEDYDLAILDEVDFALSPQYSKCLDQALKHCKNVLCLTGFITEEKKQILESYFPICYEADVEDLQEQNILNKSEFILVEFPIFVNKTIPQKTKQGKEFLVSENDTYRYWENRFQVAAISKSAIEKKYREQHVPFEDKADWKAADWNFMLSSSKRKRVLHTLESTVQVTKNLIESIHSKEGNKVLIFNTLTSECDKLPNPYHGGTGDEMPGIEALNSGAIKTLSVSKKITRGVNLVGVNYLIRATYDGSETELFQSHGRGLRLAVGQVFKYIILLPMYQDMVKTTTGKMTYMTLTTQADRWKNKMMQSLENPNIKTIKLDKTLTIKPEHGI